MKITPLIASTFTSDGGTLFGLVPKTLWSRLMTPDENNQVPQNANSLLVTLDDGRLGLIETGCGPASRFTEKERERNGLGPGWPLLETLATLGIAPEQIEFVVCTHAHWDHIGGLLAGTPSEPTRAFPKATLYLHAQEWKDATSGDPLLYKAYPRDLIDPVASLYAHSITTSKSTEVDVVPGVSLVHTSGHTTGHCLVRLHGEAIELDHPDSIFFFPPRQVLYLGDLAPTRHHLRLVYGTGYDIFPLDTRRWKHRNLPDLARDKVPVFFPHDPDLFGTTLSPHPKLEFAPDKPLRIEFLPGKVPPTANA